MRVFFRADGGAHIGMGHIMRSLSLAEEFQQRNHEIIFISRHDKATFKILDEKGIEIRTLPGISPLPPSDMNDEVEQVTRVLDEMQPDIIITDSYDITTDYLRGLKSYCKILVSIDDLAEIEFYSDIVVNGNLKAKQMNYKTLNPDVKLLLGPKYVLLRTEFKELSKRKKPFSGINKILVTMGGGDTHNLTPMIMRALSRFSEFFSVNVVVGPVFNNLDLIKTVVKQNKYPFKIFQNPENIGELMYDADLAISGGGGTLYELAATGTPAIVLCQANNQIRLADALEKFGSIINLGDGTKVDEEQVEHILTKLIDKPDIVRSMSLKCKELVDGYGATRVVQTILKSLESKKGG